MSEQHTPRKLRLERDPMHFDSMTSLRGGEHRMHLGLPDELMIEVGGWSPAGEANARRLKACWDLLTDVPTKEIEAAANYGSSWGKTGLELAAVTAQRDELLEALKCLLSLDDDHQRGACDQDVCAEVQRARAAIAKVEGGGV